MTSDPSSDAVSRLSKLYEVFVRCTENYMEHLDFMAFNRMFDELFTKETPVTRKLVIEHQTYDGQWRPFSKMSEAINNLGTQDCPEVHRHLDEYIRVLSADGEVCRWRVVEEKPAGRPAKRGYLVRTKFDSHYVVVGGSDWAIKVVPLGEYSRTLHIKKPEDTLMHLMDGAPVTGYDPS